MTRVLILGATSEIAGAVAREYRDRGARLYLVGRNPIKTAAVAERIKAEGVANGVNDPASVQYDLADLANLSEQGVVLDRAWKAFGGFDRVLIAFGVLPDEAASQHDWKLAEASLQTNLVAVITLLDRLIEHCGSPSDSRIGVIGSVAGDRGRNRVAVYSAAKGGLERYAEALQQRLSATGPRIILLKPGWVATPMTANMPPSRLIARPEQAAAAIVSALEHGKRVAYVPGWWRIVMLLVRNVPSFIFKRMRF